ncbi:MAG: hypothetical protein H6Q13_2774 [Bacteroidetes bacterium]|nr:hypothetical protein [Bacteroidota bacterium]
MGIQNQNNALVFASGIDNSGLKSDAEEGKSIVKGMTDSVVSEGNKMNDALSNTSGATQGIRSIKNESESLFKSFKPTEESAKRMREYITSLNGVNIRSLPEQIKNTKVLVKQTEEDIKSLQQTFEKAAPGKAKMFALSELEKAKKVLTETKGELANLESQQGKTSTTAGRLTSQIRVLKDEMSKMAMAGGRDSQAYDDLRQKALLLQRQLNGTNKQMKILASPMANFQGVISGVTGLTGALSAGMGVMGLFSSENANLAKIQTKLQSVMAITIGLQQVATTLNKNSPFQLVTMAKAHNLLTAANTRLAVALGISNVAAKALMATLTLGATVVVTGLIVAWNKYSSHQEQMAEKQKEIEKEVSDAINGASSTMAEQMVTLYKLIGRWDSLGGNLKKQKKFITENKDEFHKLGISVNTVTEAENVLDGRTEAVVNAMMKRARATIYAKMAMDEYEKMARGELQAQLIMDAAPTEDDYKKTRKSKSAGTSTGVFETTETYIDKSDTKNAEANRKKRADKVRIGAQVHLIWGNKVIDSAAKLEKTINADLEKAKITPFNGDDSYKKDADAAKKAAEKANKEKVEAAERIGQIKENDQKIKEIYTQGELDAQQSRINAMEDGYTKQQAQIDLDHKKRITDADKKAQELIKIAQENEEKLWLNKHPDHEKKGEVFTPTIKTVSQLPKEQQNIISTDKSNADRDKIKSEKDLLKSLKDQYQSYTDERLAIEKKYNDDIEALKKEREKAQAQGDTAQVDVIDRSIGKADTDKGKSLASVDFKQLKESPDYVRAFENLKQSSTETLNSLLSQFENAKQVAAETLDPEQLREYTKTISDIMDELENRNPFEMLAQRKSELAEAEKALAEAQKNMDDVKGGKKVVASTSYNQKTGKIDKTYLTEEKALSKLNKAKAEVIQKDANVTKAEKKVTEQISDLSTSLTDVGSAIGGTAGEIISLVGNIGSFAMSAMDGIKTVSNTTAQSVSSIEKASVILAIISTAIQLATKVAELISGKSKEQADTEKLQGVTEKISQIQDTINSLIEKRIDLINAATNAEKGYLASLTQTSIDVQKKYYEQQFESLLGNDFLAKKGKNNNLSLSELGISSIEELKEFMSSNNLLDYLNNGFGIRNLDDWQELIDAWDDLADKEEEVSNALSESLTGLSFDDAKDALDDFLLSADTTEQTIADNFEDYMKNAILNIVKTTYMTDALKGWYDNFTKDMSDGVLSDDEVKKLREEYSTIYDTAQSQINGLLDTVGIDNSSSEDGVSGKLQDALTEGTASEVLGAINMGTLDIRAIKELLPSHFANYATTMNNVSSILDETRQINANTLRTANNTDGLRDSMSNLNESLKEMKGDLEDISKNTKDTSGR